MDEQEGHREGPVMLRFPLPSWGAVYLAAAGILARLLVREREGQVGAVHTSLLQGALITLTMHWARAENPGASFRYGLPKSMAPSRKLHSRQNIRSGHPVQWPRNSGLQETVPFDNAVQPDNFDQIAERIGS